MIWAAVLLARLRLLPAQARRPLRAVAGPRAPLVSRVADLVPVALLAALIGVQVFATGQSLVIDARVVGLGVAFVALLLRAPFIVVVLRPRCRRPSCA